MYIVTGAAGFIGSCLTSYLNQQGINNLLLVDDFSRADKLRNLNHKQYLAWIHRDSFFGWLGANKVPIQGIFHLGARTDTSEQNTAIFDRLNLNYTKQVWQYCAQQQVPLVYASSAATYGLGKQGYTDSHDIVPHLRPLNPYGHSKNNFDAWALTQTQQPPFWYGLKFFNVYGPNEYHKGRMASVIWHAFKQIQQTQQMRLFRSHKPTVANGEQQRDFVYVKDVVQVCTWLMAQKAPSGLYNVGTGRAETFLNLTKATFAALQIAPNISFIDTPIDIRATYQYYTQANIQKLQNVGYTKPFHTITQGINDYVGSYLRQLRYY